MIRGRWIWDRLAMELVPAAEYYARRPAADRSDLAAPMIMRDIPAYRSAVTGETIDGRRAHRDHLRAHGCIEVGNDLPHAALRPDLPPVAQDIERAMHDETLRAEAMAASANAREAVV